jgi:hypothetical protein
MCASKTDRPDQAWSYTSIIPAMQEDPRFKLSKTTFQKKKKSKNHLTTHGG